MKILAAIPARVESSRLPGKSLLDCGGRPLVVRTAENAKACSAFDRVVVVTDSEEIAEVCCRHHVESVLDERQSWCGTSRIAAVIRAGLLDADIVVNVQVDEPLVKPTDLAKLVDLVASSDDRVIATIVSAWITPEQLADENVVKADMDYGGYCRGFGRSNWFVLPKPHVGVYGFWKRTLLAVGKLQQTKSSKRQQLEQLTWLDHDYEIKAIYTEVAPLSINAQADYDLYRAYIREHEEVSK